MMKTLKSAKSIERVAQELLASSSEHRKAHNEERVQRLKRDLFKSKRELITQYINSKCIPSLIFFLGSIGMTFLFYDTHHMSDLQNMLYHLAYFITLASGCLVGLVGANLTLYALSEDFYVDLICKRRNKYSATDIPDNLVILSHSYVNDSGCRVPLIYGIDEKETTTEEISYHEGLLIEDQKLNHQELKALNDAQGRPAYRQSLLILNRVLRQIKIDESKAKYGKHCI